MINLFLIFTNAQYEEMVKNWDGDPWAFEVKWMIGRINHWCTCISSQLSNKLNECGWQFREGDEWCKLYDQYRGLERLERLISYMTNKISNNKKISDEDVNYCWSLVGSFAKFKKDWEFISGQDQDTMMKIYRKYIKKFEEYANRKRDCIQVL